MVSLRKKYMPIFRQFLRFAAVGASGTAVQYIVLWAGVELFALPVAPASGAGYMLGSVVNYLLNYFFTFQSGKSHAETATKYYTVLAVGWCLNTGLMWLLAHLLGWNYWLAQILTTGIGLVWNFIGSRWWVFKQAGAGPA